jgi:hypothetical protein
MASRFSARATVPFASTRSTDTRDLGPTGRAGGREAESRVALGVRGFNREDDALWSG